MKVSALIAIGMLALIPVAHAQNNGGDEKKEPQQNDQKQNDQETKNGFWETNLPGGNYMVALGRIASVSRHKYVLDGAVIVDEVTIDTDSQALARFYFISPITASGPGAAAAEATQRVLELAEGAASRAGSDIQDMVVKKYPLTTHSKCIEYRLLSEAQLTSLYASAKRAWVTGKGRVYTAR